MTVNQLETNARFVGFLLVRSADARTDKKGGAYLDLTLADKTGDINCKYWDWNQLMDVPKQGSVIKVQGLVQEYNSRKQLLPGKCVIGFAMGTNEFYKWLDDNPATEFHPITFVNDPLVIRQNDNVVSVNSAISVDLLGQVAADMMGPKQFSGVGGQNDFVLGAMFSKGGRGIIALPATAARGKASRISVALAALET